MPLFRPHLKGVQERQDGKRAVGERRVKVIGPIATVAVIVLILVLLIPFVFGG